MTKQELEILKQDMDNNIKKAMEAIRDYEQGHVAYKMSKLNIAVGDRVTLKGVEYFFGGYVLPDNSESLYTIIARKPLITAFKIKKNGDSYKNRIYLYWEEEELLEKYGKEQLS